VWVPVGSGKDFAQQLTRDKTHTHTLILEHVTCVGLANDVGYTHTPYMAMFLVNYLPRILYVTRIYVCVCVCVWLWPTLYMCVPAGILDMMQTRTPMHFTHLCFCRYLARKSRSSCWPCTRNPPTCFSLWRCGSLCLLPVRGGGCTCTHMHTYAHICTRMHTYAHICTHLTHEHVRLRALSLFLGRCVFIFLLLIRRWCKLSLWYSYPRYS